MNTRLIVHNEFGDHVVSSGEQGMAGPRGPVGPVGPAFEAGDVVQMEFRGDQAALIYANGDTNEFPITGTINGGSF